MKEDTTDVASSQDAGCIRPWRLFLRSLWNNGYMFIGFIGFTYSVGYSAIWIGLASTVSPVLAWVWLYKNTSSKPISVVCGPPLIAGC